MKVWVLLGVGHLDKMDLGFVDSNAMNNIREEEGIMGKDDFLVVSGNSKRIKKEFIGRVVSSPFQADILFDRMQQNENLLSAEECFNSFYSNMSEDNNVFYFVTPSVTYFINAKYLTLAFLCLIFDIEITRGFASFILNATGIDYSVIKLDNMEKCVAYKIKEEKRIRFEQLVPLVQCNFDDYNSECGHYRNDESCSIWTSCNIQNAIDSLMEKGVLKLNGEMYEVVF